MPRVSSRIRRFLAKHLFSYLAVVAALVIVLGVVFAREPLAEAWRSFDTRLALPILGLSLLNYGLRFVKWQMQLRAAGTPVRWIDSARIYFACFTMVVTPMRLGEVYKLVFLRRLHKLPVRRTGPVLIAERLTDGVAVLALASLGLVAGGDAPWLKVVLLLTALFGAGLLLGRPSVQGWTLELLRRIPATRSRADQLQESLQSSAALYAPGVLTPALLLSLGAWFSECAGLYFVLVGLGAPIPLVSATWIYAAGTAAGNLTLLPGGLLSTEAALLGMLRQAGVESAPAVAATVLVRVATLWFAVVLGLIIALAGRRQLDWKGAREETADYS